MTSQRSVTLTREYKQRSPLFRQGEPSDGAFVVLHGRVALSTAIDSGRKLRITRADRGAILGLAETISGGPYQTSAVADSAATVHFIPKQDVLSLIEDDPATGLHVIEMLIEDVRKLYAKIRRMAYRNRGIRSK